MGYCAQARIRQTKEVGHGEHSIDLGHVCQRWRSLWIPPGPGRDGPHDRHLRQLRAQDRSIRKRTHGIEVVVAAVMNPQLHIGSLHSPCPPQSNPIGYPVTADLARESARQ